MIDTSFSTEDFRETFKKVRESTDSSPSGIHYGHYKAALASEMISRIGAKMMEFVIK
jgi:hypothetical protein